MVYDEYWAITFKHSSQVAKAGYEIAAHSNGFIEKNLAHKYGMFHDIGKFFLKPKQDRNIHPLIGYEIMQESKDYDTADICITHSFPIFDYHEYILHYCHFDKKCAEKIKNILSNIKINIYIELIQFCDKISGIDDYMKIEEKFEYYKKHYIISDVMANKNFDALMNIKKKLDSMCKCNVYDIILR
ncbi:MAG: HD domain-containing protein [Holosporales bacterium]|jgi:hypothetical protein|nr:HD domain-containing protein [Holosporales bacterium]